MAANEMDVGDVKDAGDAKAAKDATEMCHGLQPHIMAKPGDLTPYALLPGDPARVYKVAEQLDGWELIAQNREYLLIRGGYKGTPITVMSTGMGGVSVAIGVEELVKCGVRVGIRIGSAGALQPALKNGDLIVAEGAVRDEGTTQAYLPLGVPALPAPEVYQALIHAARQRGIHYTSGIIRSHDSFYRDDENQVSKFWHQRGILASEMESAALFIVGALRKMRTGALLNVVVEYGSDLEHGILSLVAAEEKRKEGERNEIIVGLEALHHLHQQASEGS